LSNIDIFLSDIMTSVGLSEAGVEMFRKVACALHVSFPKYVGREEVRQLLAFFLSGCDLECRGKVLVIIDNILNTVSRAEDAVELIFFVNELLHAFDPDNACGGIVRLRCDPKFQPILNAIKAAWSQLSSFPKIEPHTSTPDELKTAYAVLFSGLPPHDRGRLLWIIDHLFNSNSPGCDLLYEMANMKFEHMIKHAMTEQAVPEFTSIEHELKHSSERVMNAQQDLRDLERYQLQQSRERLQQEQTAQQRAHAELKRAQDKFEEAKLRHERVAEIAKLEEAHRHALSNVRQAYECKSEMVESHIGAINREWVLVDAGFVKQLSEARQALGEAKELYKRRVAELEHAHRANVENLRGHGRNTTSQPTGRQTSTTSQPTGRQPSTTSQPGVTIRPTDATAAQIRADEKFAREVSDVEFARLVAAGLV
jgi:hypothetical protein